MSFLLEFYDFMRSRKKFWLVPLMIVFLAFGGVLVFSQGSVVAPFIYSLF